MKKYIKAATQSKRQIFATMRNLSFDKVKQGIMKRFGVSEEAAYIVTDWYESEGSFEDFNSLEKFLNFVDNDIADMLNASSNPDKAMIVAREFGLYDPYGRHVDWPRGHR